MFERSLRVLPLALAENDGADFSVSSLTHYLSFGQIHAPVYIKYLSN
ncbi:hypothetical protein J2Z48_002478 [Croceifilum oryzae]|uniref:Uncharacterized protein n=1 Tax=Croceifilum oryzae TaxID=1553429 RepID=A0AAJ1WTQ7_9BACL|nr:hypothetical protein [Croceifilum oryzae]MDQ0418288.1 hypothetical protein [Croceifilum oryzae]